MADFGIKYYTGAKAESGDNTLIAAPGVTLAIKLHEIVIQNESAVATTVILKNGSTAFMRVLAQNQGDGIVKTFREGEGVLAANTALVANLSGANSCGFSVTYELVFV